MLFNTLSGRFLLLTAAFVMLAEILIFVPSVARFREDYIMSRLERAQIASLALLATDGMIDQNLERELLANAEVYNVVLRRDEVRQLVLSSPIPAPIERSFDLRDAPAWELIRDAVACLADPQNRVIRVIGAPVRQAGLLIEATMETAPLRAAMIEYGLRILGLSALISAVTAALLFLAVRRLLVTPIRRVVSHMSVYADAPEDARRIIEPQSKVVELREAEEALQSMQHQLTGALRQKDRLAQLGSAVAKVSHDLRNILTSAQLFADRMETSDDPMVKRAAPKLVNSISRAVGLCESTLAFGKAEEPPPTLTRFMVSTLIRDVVESEKLAAGENDVEFVTDVPQTLAVRADHEQLYRVLTNLVRNARQAIEATRAPGTIEISAGEEEEGWWLRVGDTGPGLPERAREHLFQPFQGGFRKGGTGLGLAISAELIRGHGGRLELLRSDAEGTEFVIHLPRDLVPGLAVPTTRTVAATEA
ncbi:HAMP domain-containing sensor histidine kinase [Defluviimonas aestuarii]|uniref:sensor histidine kinase n=1 Tax=Albidovulum aestuarii TaxID=1130726 RepID=UPI00249BDF30|nr:HAMP domain-containing sensor histidine kinase [Defluviimonas aestuarii]MDI3336392.1 HAMP domain-containing sensor histidine kinase [Defluviimonas aestuarii]